MTIKITHRGLDLSKLEVDLNCDLCGTSWSASAEKGVDGVHLYADGDTPFEGQAYSIMARATCPNCGQLASRHVKLREKA